MSISTASPVLSYVSSSDISNVSDTNGNIRYQIYFDSSISTNGSIIMFEYMLKLDDEPIYTPVNTEFGFISVDTAIQTGISNQYILSINAQHQTYTGESAYPSIQFRVYTGDKDSNEVVVTEWSNELGVYPPPYAPDIDSAAAYYDEEYLYVFIEEDLSKNTYNYEVMQFIVCFYHQDASDANVWGVSAPTYANEGHVVIGAKNYKRIVVPIGSVSGVHPSIYLSLHAVYYWSGDSYSPGVFYSVSSASEPELVAVQASDDSAPDITDVVYNVYTNDVPPPIPGNQTIRVDWNAPGNSGVPFFAVQSYELYYTTNGIDYSLYDVALSSDASSCLVNVGNTIITGSPALNLSCGDYINFKVKAITVNGQETYSATWVSDTHIFKYSEPVTGLYVSNTSVSEDGINLTVNFLGVSELDKGCGEELEYVVFINDNSYVGVGSLEYGYLSYSIVYSDLNINDVGEVTVYLQTQNTNSPYNALNGQPTTAPYIANTLTLAPVSYAVYNELTPTSQIMNLSWNDVSTGDWTATNYKVDMKIGDTWEFVANVTNATSYAYDVSLVALDPNYDPVELFFRVTATVENDDVSYDIVSEPVSEFTFAYAAHASNVMCNWAIANTTNTEMDVYVQFNNPVGTQPTVNNGQGVNNGINFFKVELYDGNYVDGNTGNLISTINKAYNVSSDPYDVYFNDVPYFARGDIVIRTYVNDTNNSIVPITSYISLTETSYVVSDVPIFTDISINLLEVTGNIVTHDSLKPYGQILYRHENATATYKILVIPSPGPSMPSTLGFVVSEPVPQPDGVWSYAFTLTYSALQPPLNTDLSADIGYVITAANNAGVGTALIVTPP